MTGALVVIEPGPTRGPRRRRLCCRAWA